MGLRQRKSQYGSRGISHPSIGQVNSIHGIEGITEGAELPLKRKLFMSLTTKLNEASPGVKVYQR